MLDALENGTERSEVPSLTLSSVSRIIASASGFLPEESGCGTRTQALVAAMFDTLFDDVRGRQINDPSWHLTGHMHIFADSIQVLCVEVLSKPVAGSDVQIFAEPVSKSGAGEPQGLWHLFQSKSQGIISCIM